MMGLFSDNLNRLAPLILLLICSHLINCTQWVVLDKPLEPNGNGGLPDKVWIQFKNGKEKAVYSAYIVNDSLYGCLTQPDSARFRTETYTLRVSLSDILNIRHKKVDIMATLIGAVIVVSLILAVGAAAQPEVGPIDLNSSP